MEDKGRKLKKLISPALVAARIYSAFVYNRQARHNLRNAMIHDYKTEIEELRTQLCYSQQEVEDLRESFKLLLSQKSVNPIPQILGYQIDGKNNRIIVVENGKERVLRQDERIPGLDISIFGDDNEIKIYRPNRLERSRILVGNSVRNRNNGARIQLKRGCTFSGMLVDCVFGENQVFSFGERSRIWGGLVRLNEVSGCIIGDDCNCSDEIRIWGSDGHAILDKNNPEKILNEVSGPIIVGDHCWLGQGVRLTKGARIPPNTIVGQASLVTKAFNEEYTVIAGVPAKVVKRGVMREPNTLSAWHLKRRKQSGERP